MEIIGRNDELREKTLRKQDYVKPENPMMAKFKQALLERLEKEQDSPKKAPNFAVSRLSSDIT